jgi:hypothetical protein
MTATVTSVRGSGLNAIYRIRRLATIIPAPKSLLLPDNLQIRMADFVMGTCGSQSPWLKPGNRIVLYFEVVDAKLVPRAWVIS